MSLASPVLQPPSKPVTRAVTWPRSAMDQTIDATTADDIELAALTMASTAGW